MAPKKTTKTIQQPKFVKAPTIWLPHDNAQVREMFVKRGWKVTFKENEADFIVFHGGADICPILYGEKPVTECGGPHLDRDRLEVRVFNKYRHHKPFIGICRGAQMLNVLNGGRLWQHVNNHTNDHEVEDWTGKTYKVTSTHHQMMIPANDGVVYATASEATLKKADGVIKHIVPDQQLEDDDEVVIYYGATDKLFSYCFQPHPEYDIDGDTEALFWDGLYNMADGMMKTFTQEEVKK